MEFIISLLMGTRLLALLGGGIGHDAPVAFLPPAIVIARDTVFLRCTLVNAYPEELRKLLRTGTPVYIYIFAALKTDDRRVVKKNVVESRMFYDMLRKKFCCIHSVRPDTVWAVSLDTAIQEASSFREIPIAGIVEIKRGVSYTVDAYAVLGKTKIEALENREIDCMFYWNFKRPSFITEKLPSEQFFTGAR